MGTQGEIYVVLGLELPVEGTEDSEIYLLNGKKVLVGYNEDKKHDILGGFLNMTGIKKPELQVRILNYDNEYGEVGEFKGKALVGYPLANESYVASATRVPGNEVIEGLKPKLLSDLKDRLGVDAKLSDLELFLLYDFAQ